MLASYAFLQPFTFILYVCLYLRWISVDEYIVMSLIYSFIQSENLSLMSVYKLLIFKVLIYMIGLIPTIFITAFY